MPKLSSDPREASSSQTAVSSIRLGVLVASALLAIGIGYLLGDFLLRATDLFVGRSQVRTVTAAEPVNRTEVRTATQPPSIPRETRPSPSPEPGKVTEDKPVKPPAPPIRQEPASIPKSEPPRPVVQGAPARAQDNTPTISSRSERNATDTRRPGTIYLQVAAVTREAPANELARTLRGRGFPVVVLAPEQDAYYRVQVGPYLTAESAQVASSTLKSQGFDVYIRRL
jgi:cell division septation protein DedD